MGARRRRNPDATEEDLLSVANDAALSRQYARAIELLIEMKPRMISTSFTTVRYDLDDGDGYDEQHGWVNEEGDEIGVNTDEIEALVEAGSDEPVSDALAANATDWLIKHGVSEASSGAFHPGIWYVRHHVFDYEYSGVSREEAFHLYNFTKREQQLIYESLKARRVFR